MSTAGSLIASALFLAAEGDGKFNPFQWSPGAMLWTVVIFLGALVPMWKFVFGPITAALAKRDQAVLDAAQSAEQARKEAAEAKAAAETAREEARAEARKMVEEATARAQRQGDEALAKAKAEAERQMLKAREDIEAEKQRALSEIRQEVVQLAIASAGRILEREVDAETHRKLVTDFLGDLGGRRN